MAIAQRKPQQTPHAEGDALRAKSLRPFERSRPALRAETLTALQAFDTAAQHYEAGTRGALERSKLRTVASQTMDELLVELHRGALPDDLATEVERWDEGQFAGTRADVELANFAVVELLGSRVRVDEGLPADDVD